MFGAFTFGQPTFGQIAGTTAGIPSTVTYYKTRATGNRASLDGGVVSRTGGTSINTGRRPRISRQQVGVEFD